MKQCFNQNGVKTADWWVYRAGQFFLSGTSDITPIEELSFPVIVKNIYGSRGRGNSKIDSPENLLRFFERHTTHTNYIIEKYYNYSREYRLHVTKNGCFYTCRKMIKADTPDDKRWYRNDSNSVWIIEANDNFDRPTNWDTIVNESVKALNAVGLDFGAVDLKIQSATDEENELRNNPNFIVIEINSAPSFGDLTLERYLTELPKLLKEKYENKTA